MRRLSIPIEEPPVPDQLLGQLPGQLAGRAAALLAALALFSAVSCSRSPSVDHETVADLAADLPFARHVTEREVLDLAAPGSGAWLGAGWSHIEATGDGTDFRWAVGESSSLTFDLVARRDLDIELTAKPFRFAGPRAQSIEVFLNGVSVAAFDMRKRWHSYRLRLPRENQVLGQNTLLFRYARFRQLEDSSNKAGRRFAVAWRKISFAAALEARTTPATLRDGAALFVPEGSRLEFYVRLPSEARLEIEEILPRGNQPGRLAVGLASDGAREIELLEPINSRGGAKASLQGDRNEVVRLSLTVNPEGPISDGAGYVLRAPRVTAPSPRSAGSENAVVTETHGSLPSQPNILVYLVDTLRTDAVGSYGGDPAASPRFDEFAADATLFENAVGQSSWTRSSVASVFTGLWPGRHGAVDRLDMLAPEARTLAEILGEHGYSSAAFITNPNVTGKFGFSQGFDEFRHIRTNRASDEVNERVFAWLAQRSEARPFFLYVHTMDPHHPYLPPPPMRPNFAPTEGEMRAINRLLRTLPQPPDLNQHVDRFRALYDGAAQFNDRSFGELLDHLETLDLLAETIIVFLSDHGEEFLEHGHWQHGKNLHAETLNVPLAIRFPEKGRGARVEPLVGHIDILPTLLESVGIAPPEDLDGTSLIPLLEDGSTASGESAELGRVYAHLKLDRHESVGVIDEEWKLLINTTRRGTPEIGLYDWLADPGERNNLASQHPIRVRYLESLIARRLASELPSLNAAEAELDSELERSLRALGYLR